MSGLLKGRTESRAVRIVRFRGFGPLLALVLGLLSLGARSVATDEAFTWGIVQQPDWSGFWEGLKFVGGNMAAYFVLLRAIATVGDGVVWLRLPSLLFMVGTVALLQHVGTTWFDRRTGTIASILAATSVPLLYYAIEIRSYAFVGFMATAMWYFFERALRRDRWADWIGTAVAAGLAVSGHVIMALTLPAIGIMALVRGSGRPSSTVARLIPIVLAVLPSIGLIAIGDGAKTDWIPALSLTSLARAGRFLLGDHAQFTAEGSGFVIAALYAGLYVAAVLVALRKRSELTTTDRLAWLWFTSLPLSIVAVSVVEPVLWHRYLIGALPAGILLVSRMLAASNRRRLVVGVVGLVAVLGVVRFVALRPHSADEYERVAQLIETKATSDDVLVMEPPWARAGLDYYWRDDAPVRGMPDFGPGFDRGLSLGPVDWVEDGARIWLVERSDTSQVWVDTQRDESDFSREALADLVPAGYELVEQFDVQRFRIWLYEPTAA